MAILECSKCGNEKDESLFVPSRGTGKVARKRRCLDCKRKQVSDWHKRNPNRWRETRDPQAHREASKRDYHKNGLMRLYGITAAERDRQAEIQGFACAVCRTETLLHIDHCHGSGVVRGLLCGKCNRGLGLFGDDPELLERAITYLREGGSWQS